MAEIGALLPSPPQQRSLHGTSFISLDANQSALNLSSQQSDWSLLPSEPNWYFLLCFIRLSLYSGIPFYHFRPPPRTALRCPSAGAFATEMELAVGSDSTPHKRSRAESASAVEGSTGGIIGVLKTGATRAKRRRVVGTLRFAPEPRDVPHSKQEHQLFISKVHEEQRQLGLALKHKSAQIFEDCNNSNSDNASITSTLQPTA